MCIAPHLPPQLVQDRRRKPSRALLLAYVQHRRAGLLPATGSGQHAEGVDLAVDSHKGGALRAGGGGRRWSRNGAGGCGPRITAMRHAESG
jgi:hypothetical protein